MEENIKDVVFKFGFESVGEYYRLTANVDFSTNEKIKAFKDWQTNDGSKEGLLKLF